MGDGLVMPDGCVKPEQGGPVLAGSHSRRKGAHTVQRIQQEYQVRGGQEEKGTHTLGIPTSPRESTKLLSVFGMNV